MPGEYPGTSTPFHAMPLPDLVAIGQALNHVPVSDAAYLYRDLAETLRSAGAGVRAAVTQLQGAHEGAAAEAAALHLHRLAALGDAGAAQATISLTALIDEADYVARARNTIAGVRVPAEPEGLSGDLFGEYEAYATQVAEAVDAKAAAATLYETNTNVNYARSFQPYQPPAELEIDSAAGPATGTPDWDAGGGSGAGGFGAGGGSGGWPAAVDPAGSALASALPGGAATGGAGAAGTMPASPGTGVPSGFGSPGGGSGIAPGTAGAVPVAPVGPGPGSGPGSGSGSAVRPGGPAGSGPAPIAPSARPVGPPSDRSAPQATRPLGTGRAPAPAPLTTWQPGQPWSSRGGAPGDPTQGGRNPAGTGGVTARGPAGGIGTPLRADAHPVDGRRGLPPGTPTGGPHGGAPGTGSRPGGGYGHVPFIPGAAGAGQQEGARSRPTWLLEDDPDAIWFAGIPSYTEPVIGGSDQQPER